jgi:Restriction endonuclease
LPGKLSGTQRQIDILVEEYLPSGRGCTAVDAKQRTRKVDVKEIESFIGLLHDTQMQRGILVSASGYTEAALTRAFRDDVDLDLDIFNLEEFREWQADGVITYSGRNAVLLPAPFGWVVDGQHSTGLLARLYRRGSTFEEATQKREFMYVNLWDRRPPVDALESLLMKQEEEIRTHSPDAVIVVRNVPMSAGYRGCIRRANIVGYPTAEITGFIEFPKFVFFAVLFTPFVVERRNVRKLEYMLQKVLPISVR